MQLSVFCKALMSILLSFITLLSIDLSRISVLQCKRQAIPTGVLEAAEDIPETPAAETEYVRVSDRLTMPRITAPAKADEIRLDLNAVLTDGYAAESLVSEAFAAVFDKVILFRAGEDCKTAYVLGEPAAITDSLRQTEEGYFISRAAAADVFGGDLPGSEAYINVKDVAAAFGLTLYHTDSGLVFFSVGEAFDPVKGYYVAEEAEKLFLSEEAAEAYSANMFVDVPHVLLSGERNAAAYSYPALDLNANVAAYASQGVRANVPLGPAIVAGQGESGENYTVVRVFDAYQTLHTQFCAYPASVRGGVQVAATKTAQGFRILTAPYTSREVSALRCYDANGAYLFSVSPTGGAPYAVASGAFLGGEDVFAVTSRNGGAENRRVEFFSAQDGSLLASEALPVGLFAGVLLSADRVSAGGDALIVYAENNVLAYRYQDRTVSEIPLGLKKTNGVFASAFGGYWATYNAADLHKAFSEVTVYENGEPAVLNVGEKENLFISTAASKNGAYVRYGQFWHTRLEFATAAHSNTQPGNTGSIRVNDIASFTVTPSAEVRSKYNTQYNMWEPCATHRWNQTGGMRNLISYIDPDTGLNGYAVLTKENERTDYVELGSSYFNGTYAPYIEALDRLNYWTRRTYLQELSTLYRDAPEYTAAVSPVHEHEIDSGAGSVGDYNPNMIAGFRIYLKELYGTIEAVNEAFGTSFASFAGLDAPRNAGRGAWDCYPAAGETNAYFNQWSIYNRTIVSRRIVESYREALLAGFPPELIKAHQIPEGDAVSGFLGEADTRISPVDVALAVGTGYGGTRYFTWFRARDSFLALARDSGHNNSTLGEYSAMNTDKFESYRQLKFLFNNGVMFTHVMNWAGGAENGEKMDAGEQYAVNRLQSENVPRSASSGGTGGVRAYVNGDRVFNVVEIGSKKESPGLLKSVNADGSFEGTVYLQPFHAAAAAVDIAAGDKAAGTGRLRYNIAGRTDAKGKAMEGIQYGDTVDVRITARPLGEKGTLTVQVWHEGNEDVAAAYTFDVTGDEAEYRYSFKNQLFLTDCAITVTFRDAEITDSDVTLLYERTARRYYGETAPEAHAGGVSFDLMY